MSWIARALWRESQTAAVMDLPVLPPPPAPPATTTKTVQQYLVTLSDEQLIAVANMMVAALHM